MSLGGERHIVALGGGGFSDDDALLDDFVLGLSRAERPKVCFLPTATGDSLSYIVRFYDAFTKRACEPSHLALFGAPRADEAREHLLTRDVVYVGGGNTANMLAVWRLHGVDGALREAWEAGVVLAGVSAGAICWFEASVTDSFGVQLAPLQDGLGLLPGSMCPHYDSEDNRRPVFRRLVADGFPAGFAADDGVALHFSGTDLADVVTTRAGGRAFRVELAAGGVTEVPLSARDLR